MKKYIFSLCLIFTAVLLFSSGAFAAMSDDDFVDLCSVFLMGLVSQGERTSYPDQSLQEVYLF